MLTATDLVQKKCHPQVEALTDTEIEEHLGALADWILQDDKLTRGFHFENYHQTLAFVNALAWMVHAEDHHPELTLTYNRCIVRFDTHSVNHGAGGLSENDFICAAKADAIHRQSYC